MGYGNSNRLFEFANSAETAVALEPSRRIGARHKDGKLPLLILH